MVSPALPKDHELVTRVYLVRSLRAVVRQLCSERLTGKLTCRAETSCSRNDEYHQSVSRLMYPPISPLRS